MRSTYITQSHQRPPDQQTRTLGRNRDFQLRHALASVSRIFVPNRACWAGSRSWFLFNTTPREQRTRLSGAEMAVFRVEARAECHGLPAAIASRCTARLEADDTAGNTE